MRIASRARRWLWRWTHRLVLGRFGWGLRVDADVWEQQFGSGYWDFLGSQAELDHYTAIAALIERRGSGQRVLDVGCGWGRLPQLIAPGLYERYMGVDIAEAAVAKARTLGLPRTEFVAADFERWRPHETFDTIVFNESLYYARRPVRTALRYAASLRSGGALIVSCVEYGHHRAIWTGLERHFHVSAGSDVSNGRGQRWRVRLLEPRNGQQ